MTKHSDILGGLAPPVIASPLFIVSTPKLVIAQCCAGIVGAMPALNARPASLLDDWLGEITEGIAAHDAAHPHSPAAPFAINQIVHRSNDRLEHDMRVIEKYRVRIVITSLGARPEINQAVHAYGGITLHDVVDNGFARKAVEKGADGLIAVATGAGGARGNPQSFCSDSRNSALVRWAAGSVGFHCYGACSAGCASHGRRLCLYRFRIHRHR